MNINKYISELPKTLEENQEAYMLAYNRLYDHYFNGVDMSRDQLNFWHRMEKRLDDNSRKLLEPKATFAVTKEDYAEV